MAETSSSANRPALSRDDHRGENLLDDDIRNSVSFKKDEVLQPGWSIPLYGSVKLN